MGRTAAVIWHASLSIIAAGLYFFFVVPRWFELTDFIPHTLGTVLRVVTAAAIALAALPVTFTLLRARKPEYRTPKLALQLLVGSIVAHLAAGVLILGTAISEIWLSVDRFGPWLFGIYGAAATIALLGIGAFYLSLVAELPPPPPKPIQPKKAKQPKQRRRSRKQAKTGTEDTGQAEDDADAEGAEDAEDSEDAEVSEDTERTEEASADSGADSDDGAEAPQPAESPDSVGDEVQSAETPTDGQTETAETLVHTGGRHKLPRGNRHKLPTGKRRLREDG